MNGIIYPLYTPPVITRNYSLIVISTLYNSLLHTYISRLLVTQFKHRTVTVLLNYTLQILHIKSSLHSRTLATNS
jgi:hypothetical protein